MKEFFRKYHLSFDPLTIANIIIGIMLTVNPEFSTGFICIILGIVSMVWGITSLYKHFKAKKYGFISRFDMIQAIAGIFLSFILIFCRGFLAAVLPVIIGLTIIFQSISKINMALYQKRSGAGKWHLGFVLNIIGLILGLSLVFNPFSAFMSVIRLVGIVLLINGVSRLFTDFFFAHEMDKINHESDDNIIDVEYTDV